MRRALGVLTYAAALGVAPQTAFALLQSCTVAATSVPFGTYNPASVAALSGSGTITVTCTATLVSIVGSWTILLNTGNSGTFAARQLTSGANSLAYNLYTTAAHSQIWGDGSAGTGTVSDSQLLSVGTHSTPYTVFGQIPPLQDMPTGIYTDVITVTLNF